MRTAIRTDARRFHASAENRRLLGEGILRERPAQDSTFLFISAAAGDDGQRPLAPGVVYWNSARLQLRDATGASVATNGLVAGMSYLLEVSASNGGDLDAHSAKVEAFLAPLRLGLAAGPKELLGVATVSAPSRSDALATFPFTATPAMTGNRSLFARAFSFVNNDLPASADAFDVAVDRHLGQQSLVILDVPSSNPLSPLEFDVAIDAPFAGQPLSLVFRRNAAALETLRGYPVLQAVGAAPSNLFLAFPIRISSADGSQRSVNATARTDRWQADFTLPQGAHRFTVRFAGIQVPPQHATVFDVELTRGTTSLGGFEFVLVSP